MTTPRELAIYATVPALSTKQLRRLPAVKVADEQLRAQHQEHLHVG